MRHKFTPEQLYFLRSHVFMRTKQELTELFNQHFKLDLTVRQIVACAKNHKFPSSGLDGRFKKGQKAWNKDKKGINLGGENGKKTQFKKGHTPHNHRPVGSERINVDGYVEIKVAEPRKWLPKHRVIWEKVNGPVPIGHAVIFGDRNRRNFDLDNLILISKKQLSIMNKHGLIQKDTELTKTGIIIADLYQKIGDYKKRVK